MIYLYIKERASEKGMTLKDVCRVVGYKSLPSFYRQINNPENISMQTLLKIADALECEVNDLFVKPSLADDSKQQDGIIICPHCGKEIKYGK